MRKELMAVDQIRPLAVTKETAKRAVRRALMAMMRTPVEYSRMEGQGRSGEEAQEREREQRMEVV